MKMILAMVIRFINMLPLVDLFEAERAALERRVDPRLVQFIEALVKAVDKAPVPGGEKKGEVWNRLEKTNDDILAPIIDATANYLINKTIEFAVTKLRG